MSDDQEPPGSLRDANRRLSSQIVAILTVTWLAAAIPFFLVGRQMVADAEDEIETGRLRLAELTAAQADRVLTEAFYEVELMATEVQGAEVRAEGRPLSPDDVEETRTIYGRNATFSSGVMYLDGSGAIVFSQPDAAERWPVRGTATEVLGEAAAADARTVSEPFRAPFTGDIVVALSLPVYDDDGSRAGTMVGLLDLTEPLISDLVEPAGRLGATGHADIIDDEGLVVASTAPGLILETGAHAEFHERMGAERVPTVELVEHESGAGDHSERHLMAYAPLRHAPWGIALGASEEETLHSVNQMRQRLIALGFAATVTFALAVALVVRRISAARR